MDALDDTHALVAATMHPSATVTTTNNGSSVAQEQLQPTLVDTTKTTDTAVPLTTPTTTSNNNNNNNATDDAMDDALDAKKREVQLGRELFVFTASKAGMHNVDNSRVQQIVFDMSKDSPFFQNSLKRNDKVDARIAAMQQRLAALSTAKRAALERRIDATAVAQLEAARDLTRTIVVVDMDMFYAAVEMRDDPSLRDVPLAVGGTNMICTTNYIARQFGVRAAMPGFIGKELCPELVFVAPNFTKYKAIAAQLRAVFALYDPHFTAFSLDEARLDVTEFMDANWRSYVAKDAKAVRLNHHADDDDDEDDALNDSDREAVAAAIVNEIRQKIFEATALTASAGVAVNTMLAKIASDTNKPNGQCVIPFTRSSVVAFIAKQPVRKIGGIGKVMEKILAALNITTGADLFLQRAALAHIFSAKTASWLLRTSLAIQAEREATPRKSFSRERTFQRISDPLELDAMCHNVCRLLTDDLTKAQTGARTLTLKLKCADFSVRTRSVSFATTLQTLDAISAAATAMLRKELPLTLRLLGVRASALVAVGDSHNAEGAVATKRQLGIDRFAVATTGVDEEEEEEEEDTVAGDDGFVSALDDALCANDDAANDGVRVKTARAAVEKSDSSRSSSNAMTRFVTALDKDATRDVVAAMLATLTPSTSAPLDAVDASLLSSATEPAVKDAPHDVGVDDTTAQLQASFQPCPICSRMINASNSIAISTHVDACIHAQQQPKATTLSQWRQRESSSSSSSSSKRRRTASRSSSVNNDVPPSFVDAMAQHQPCPICGDLIDASSSKRVNAHIDACILANEQDALANDNSNTSTKGLETLSSSISDDSNSRHVLPPPASSLPSHARAFVKRQRQRHAGASSSQHSIRSFFATDDGVQ